MNEPLSHISSIEYRLKSVKYLIQLKNKYTYQELSKIFQLPMTVLNRYIKGHVLPSFERARQIFKIFLEYYDVKDEIKKQIIFDEDGYFDNSKLITNNFWLNVIAAKIYNKYYDRGITKILTAAVDGIPLAVLVGNKLGIDTIIAKKSREAGVQHFLIENYSPGHTGMIVSLYLPTNLISNQDKVLIVEDIIRSGETQQALCRLISRSGALISGIFTIVGIGEEKWKNQLKKTILNNFLLHLNIDDERRGKLINCFLDYDIDQFNKLLRNVEKPKYIIESITRLLNDEVVDIFINIDEPT
ncbi:MAG: phosphoribosyltransferase family protein [Candidatus Helarchaeota archaeon]